jgi:hypothetical protein
MIVAKFLAPPGFDWRFEDHPRYGRMWHLGKVLDPTDPWSRQYVPMGRMGRDFAPMWTVTEETLRVAFYPALVIRMILEESAHHLKVIETHHA